MSVRWPGLVHVTVAADNERDELVTLESAFAENRHTFRYIRRIISVVQGSLGDMNDEPGAGD